MNTKSLIKYFSANRLVWEVRCRHCWPPERKTEADVGHEITSCPLSEFSFVYIVDSGSPNTIGTALSVFARWQQALKCVLFLPPVASKVSAIGSMWLSSQSCCMLGYLRWCTRTCSEFILKSYRCLIAVWEWNKDLLLKDIIGKFLKHQIKVAELNNFMSRVEQTSYMWICLFLLIRWEWVPKIHFSPTTESFCIIQNL